MNETPEVSRLDVLGGFAVTSSAGQRIAISSRKAQVLIAYLAHRSGQLVARAKLASMFWSDTTESEARHSLRQCLLVLRQTLAPASGLLEVTGDAVRLRRDMLTSDAQQFERLVGEATEDAFERAIAIYRGEFLEGIQLAGEPIDEWIVFERRRLAHLMKRALTGLLESSQSAGKVDDAIQTATRLLAIDPQQNDLRETLARLYGDPGSDQRNVILATTDPAARRVAGDVLGAAGYAVRSCFDGADLLLEIGSVEPNAVLLDATLPLFSPGDLVRSLSAKLPHLPVICLGDQNEEVESAMLSLGAADFVRKPVEPEVLLLRVDNAIGAQGRRSQKGA